MAWMPFIFIMLGVVTGFIKFPERFFKLAEIAGNIALTTLMLAIGINIGTSDTVIKNIGDISFNCGVITLCALGFSIIAVFILEKTVLPLNELQNKILSVNNNFAPETKGNPEKKSSAFVWIIPVCIILGIITGIFFMRGLEKFNGMVFTGSLTILYISVGVGLAQNRIIFTYVKLLGWKVILISAAIILGSLTGGLAAGLMLGLELHISVISACGMSYGSLTGAFMTQVYGIDTGTYGFLVNVMREFLTIMLLPLLVRISKGAPIASGGAAAMDTVLIPVTKFIGAELSLVVLITGTILTFAVPVLIQLLSNILF